MKNPSAMRPNPARAEALNLGAHDVLAKPFDAGEAVRVLSLAGSHKRNDREIRNRTTLKMAAVG